jgi:hypothetical protein
MLTKLLQFLPSLLLALLTAHPLLGGALLQRDIVMVVAEYQCRFLDIWVLLDYCEIIEPHMRFVNTTRCWSSCLACITIPSKFLLNHLTSLPDVYSM